MKILITGSQGMLGQDLVNVFLSAGHEVIPATRKDLDITDQISVNTFVDQLKPDVIINAAAYNAVDAIEKDEEFNRAMKINGEAPGYLAQASARVGASFVHFSTDYVFDGNGKQYYAEDDAVTQFLVMEFQNSKESRWRLRWAVGCIFVVFQSCLASQGSEKVLKRILCLLCYD
ncbi:sugar nucleotide-binding protein [Patescibacteria group bacterium]|nr:sugar nucleotide-binding protein [Patescibacteria group bacterium]MCG2687338.1 sugar nucleotide-binding protein [Candidatus Parcubacteria bacterium]